MTESNPGRGEKHVEDANKPEDTPIKKSKPKRKPAWKKAILDCIVVCGSVKAACEAVDIDESWVYECRHKDPEFEAAFQIALEKATKNLEQEAFRRAKKGSDRLVEFLLSRRDPRYKNKEELQLGGKMDIKVEFTRDDADKTS